MKPNTNVASHRTVTKDGRRILDFLSGYCVYNAGHNHPYIVQALKEELDKSGPRCCKSCLRIAGNSPGVYVNWPGEIGKGLFAAAAVKASKRPSICQSTTRRDGIVYAR